jgi:hypothetical protein
MVKALMRHSNLKPRNSFDRAGHPQDSLDSSKVHHAADDSRRSDSASEAADEVWTDENPFPDDVAADESQLAEPAKLLGPTTSKPPGNIVDKPKQDPSSLPARSAASPPSACKPALITPQKSSESNGIRESRKKAKEAAKQAAAARLNAVWADIFKPICTTINPTNLVVPVPQEIEAWADQLNRQRQWLAARAMTAVYFFIACTGELTGQLPTKLLATWIWGVGEVPTHWRTQLAQMLSVVVHVCENPETGQNRLHFSSDAGKDRITFKASPKFLGTFSSMVAGGGVKFIRGYKTRISPTTEQFQRLTAVLGYDGYVQEKGGPSARNLVQDAINEKRMALSNAVTLSSLARQKQLMMQFMPAMLGQHDACRDLGLVARVVAQNHSRRSTVTNRRIAKFAGGGTLINKALVKGVTYDVFAGNGTWKGKGYFASIWVEHHGLKEGQAAKLFELWSAAVGPLQLVIVGVDKANGQYDLNQMTEMAKAAPGKLWRLNIRIYSPEDWQTRWTRVFQMPLPETAMTLGGPGEGGKRPVDPPGDLAEIAELVHQAGGVRQTARTLIAQPHRIKENDHVEQGRSRHPATRV